jgi:hypothetical protein
LQAFDEGGYNITVKRKRDCPPDGQKAVIPTVQVGVVKAVIPTVQVGVVIAGRSGAARILF